MMRMLRSKRTSWGMEGIRYTEAVWAKYGSYYYPGRLVDVDNVPGDIHKKLPTTAEKYTICWYEENNYSIIQKHKVEGLGNNRIDKARAEQSLSIQKNYHLALYDSVKEESTFNERIYYLIQFLLRVLWFLVLSCKSTFFRFWENIYFLW